MRIISDIKNNRWFFVVSVALLFFSMTINLMGIVDTESFYNRNAGTEALFGNQIVCGGDAEGGFLLSNWSAHGRNVQLTDCNLEELRPYTSSFNLVGRLYGLGYKGLSQLVSVNPFTYIKFALISNALFVAAILALFLVWVRTNFGNITGTVALVLTAMSPQLMINSATMIAHYNVICFILLVYCLYYYKLRASHKYRAYFWAVLAVLFCLKALTGSYEYITTYTAMAAAVVGYYLWIQRASIKTYIKELSLVAVFCSLGLLTGLGIHVGAIAAEKGSVAEAVNAINGKLTKRVAGETDVNPYRALGRTAPEVLSVINVYVDTERRETERNLNRFDLSFTDKVVDNILSGINYLMLPVVSIPVVMKEPLATFVQSFAFFLVILLVAWKQRRSWAKNKVLNRKVEGLYIGLAIAFVGYLSWQIVARNHSLVHPHLNGFTMYIPFALLGYIVIGLLIDDGLQKLKRSYK